MANRAFGLERTLHHAKRVQRIFTVLVRYGFVEAVQAIGLDHLLDKGKRILTFGRADAEIQRLPPETRLRKAIEELGTTFVKMGQILSTRPDLIPPAMAEEFRKLQDDVAPVPFAEIQASLKAEFPDGLDAMFESIEETPLASASMAQVHRAVLKDGTHIVLKVLRPGLRQELDSDVELMRMLAKLAQEYLTNLGYNPVDVVEQFSRELRRETDLKREGASTDRLRKAFKDDEHIGFARVYWDATTKNVLAMEEILGTPLSRLDPATLSDEERNDIVKYGTDAVFRQCFELGFFHADPHPGNLFVCEGGKRLYFVDCGMTGQIDPDTASLLADLVQGVVAKDLDLVSRTMTTLADAPPAVGNQRELRADVWDFISRFDRESLGGLGFGTLLRDFFDALRRHGLSCPADLVYLIKAITTIEGVGEQIAPDFDIVANVRVHVERFVRRRYGIRALRRRMRRSVLGYAQLLTDLPTHMQAFLQAFARNRATIHLEHLGLDDLTETVDRAAANITNGLIVSALIMGSSILILADRGGGDDASWISTIAILGYLASGILGVRQLWIQRRH